MKLEDLVEAIKKHKLTMPKQRHRDLAAALKTRKGGRHYSEKSDYVRSKEKEKSRKEIRDQE